eukprot:Hpha_TRINITY_DN12822_c0_g1::TRINITY_DN12822_c0_g1_i1::g.24290::m.24290
MAGTEEERTMLLRKWKVLRVPLGLIDGLAGWVKKRVIDALCTAAEFLFRIVSFIVRCWLFFLWPLRYVLSRRKLPVKVVVVGGNGFAGAAAARRLHGEVEEVVCVDMKAYTEYTPGVLRCFLRPHLHAGLVSPPPKSYSAVHRGKATGLREGQVTYHTPEGEERTLQCDYAVVATGCEYAGGITATAQMDTLPRRSAFWQQQAAELRKARTILVLGGGAVGTELAAEIAYYLPAVDVTLVDAQRRLVPQFPESSATYCERWLRDRGVEIVLGEWLDGFDEKGCVLKSGREVKADLVFNCLGSAPSRVEMAAGICDRKGFFRAESSLRMHGHHSVFCCGDVMTHPSGDVRLAYNAELSGAAAACNILNLVRGKQLLQYPDCKAGDGRVPPLLYVLSLGPYDGTMGFAGVVLSGSLTAFIKHMLEWTKVRQMRGDPVCSLLWSVADRFTLLFSPRASTPNP